MTAVIILSCLSFLMLLVICVLLNKKRRVRRVRKMPSTEDFGRSEVIFINSRRAETKFE